TSPLLGTCYISFNALDRVFCEKLHADLQANGLRCWFLPEDKGSGVLPKVDETALVYDKLVAICSKHSMKSPPFVSRLVQAVELEEQIRRSVLYCVTRDDCLLEWEHPRKEQVLAAAYADFRHWERPESYERGLGKVLNALH